MSRKKKELDHLNFKLYEEDLSELSEKEKNEVKNTLSFLRKSRELTPTIKRYIIEGILRDKGLIKTNELDTQILAKDLANEFKKMGLIINKHDNELKENKDEEKEPEKQKRERNKNLLNNFL